MGKLEVIFKIRLAYPVLRMSVADTPAVIHFADTGNTVRLEPPQFGPLAAQSALDGFEQMTLRVERQCTDEQGKDTSESNADRLQIKRDAARAFSQLFDAIREAGLTASAHLSSVISIVGRFLPVFRLSRLLPS